MPNFRLGSVENAKSRAAGILYSSVRKERRKEGREGRREGGKKEGKRKEKRREEKKRRKGTQAGHSGTTIISLFWRWQRQGDMEIKVSHGYAASSRPA